mmetsp:Transcript_17408/g.23461  ORF Transcript_17408/g.23461 Transcript_17408/m.23461 type:complete len:112 (-) Transcript_17408:483-818(-)
MHFNGFERRAIAMQTESCSRRTCYALQAVLFLSFHAVAGGLFIYRDYNAKRLNAKLCGESSLPESKVAEQCSQTANDLYDVGFLLWRNWSDDAAASQYLTDIQDYDEDAMK